ncbi:hypothetical protein D3C81_1360260 [compost metagenome]
MVEEQVEKDAGIAPPLGGKARHGRPHPRVTVGVGIDAPVQTDGRLDVRRIAPGQRPLDEVAVQAAEQLPRLRTAEVQVG